MDDTTQSLRLSIGLDSLIGEIGVSSTYFCLVSNIYLPLKILIILDGSRYIGSKYYIH